MLTPNVTYHGPAHQSQANAHARQVQRVRDSLLVRPERDARAFVGPNGRR